MLPAVDHQPASLNGRSNFNATRSWPSKDVPSAWRFIVLPSRAKLSASLADGNILRCDAAHLASVSNPQLVWSTQFGVQPELDAPSFGLQSSDASHRTSQAAGRGYSSANGAKEASFAEPKVTSKDRGTSSMVDERYRSLLAEAAHDIRAPLGVAQQILARIASRVRSEGTLNPTELRLLDSANDRLQQASAWCSGILAPERLDQANSRSVRQRFYPHQLMALVAPIVNSLAQRQNVQLHWVGWDHSLPRLYLDSNQLARVLMNLITNAIEASAAGSHLSVRVAWQTNVTQRLVIAIEDEGSGLDAALLKFVNNERAAPPPQAGIGLATVKSLVVALGGALSAQTVQTGGTLLRITLPVDNRMSLVRGWLIQNAERAAGGGKLPKSRIQLHVLRSSGLNTALADQLLQQAAAPNDFVYRIADDRWIWLSVIQFPSPLETVHFDATSQGAVERLSAQLTERMAVESGRLNCQLAFEWADIDLHSLHNSLNHRNLLPQLSTAIADKLEQLRGNRIPPIDELNSAMVSEWKNNRDLDSAAAQRPNSRTRNAGTLRVDAAEANSMPTKRHHETSPAPSRTQSFASSFLNSDPSQFEELAQDWRAQQAELRLQS